MNNNAIQKYEESKPKLPARLQRAKQALEMSQGWTIETPKHYAHVGQALTYAKARRTEIEEDKEKLHDPAAREMRKAGSEYTKVISAWKDVERSCNRLLSNHDAEQERIARKRQEELRQLAEAEAAKEKKEAEALAKNAEEDGDLERAQEIREDAEQPILPVPMISRAVPKFEGLKAPTTVWHYEVLYLAQVPEDYLKPREEDGGKIKAEAKRTHGRCAIPGIKVWSETVRSKK